MTLPTQSKRVVIADVRLRVLGRPWRFGRWPKRWMDAGTGAAPRAKGFDIGPLRLWWG